MTARMKRLSLVGLCALFIMSAAALVAYGLRHHADLFYTPRLLAERGMPETGKRVRIGGFVASGSLVNGQGTQIQFTIEDGSGYAIDVSYEGIVPDLFREGEGVVATGRFAAGSALFAAEEILAKHDETYQPRELEELQPAKNRSNYGL